MIRPVRVYKDFGGAKRCCSVDSFGDTFVHRDPDRALWQAELQKISPSAKKLPQEALRGVRGLEVDPQDLGICASGSGNDGSFQVSGRGYFWGKDPL